MKDQIKTVFDPIPALSDLNERMEKVEQQVNAMVTAIDVLRDVLADKGGWIYNGDEETDKMLDCRVKEDE